MGGKSLIVTFCAFGHVLLRFTIEFFGRSVSAKLQKGFIEFAIN